MAHVLAKDLREAVLQAALSGKLTNHLPNDSKIEELLNSNDEIRAQKIKNKEIKKENIKYIEETPFDIPDAWKWVRFNEVFTVLNGDRGKNYPSKSKLSKTGSIPFISALNINGKNVNEDENLLYLTNEQYEKLNAGKLKLNDIVMCIRGSLGKHGRFQFEKGAIASSLVIIRKISDICNDKYLFYYLDSNLLKSEIKQYDNGTAQPNLAADSLKQFMFPLPPIEEQQRIVDKVEELMAKIDEYEKLENQLVELKKEFPGDMKSAILQAAIEGKLTEQHRNDKGQYQIIEAYENDIEVAKSWELVKLQDVAKFNGGYAFKSTNFTSEGIRVIRISDFNEKGILNTKVIRHAYHDYLDNYKINKGDILMCMTGGTVGKKVHIKSIFEDMYTNQRIANIRVFSTKTFDKYINYVLETPLIKSIINTNKNSTNDNISMDLIKSFPIPLPPIDEQQHIVELLDKLLPLCDGLI